MRVNERMKKLLSIVLTLCMVLSYIPAPAYAVGTDCTHHTEHTAECGYVEAVAGVPCAHVHDENCGYVEAVAEVLCACEATDENGAIVHTEGCGYVAPVEGSNCTHVHDEACGYAEAVEAHECHYECAECAIAPANEEPGDGTPVCTCTVKCGETVDTNCAVCSADPTACEVEEPPVVATNNIDAAEMTPEDLKAAVDSALAAGYTAITVNLAENADATMFSAITAALAADYVADGTVDLTISGAKTVPEYGFFDDDYSDNDDKNIAGDKLKSLTLTDVETIGEYAFSACTYLESVNLPQVVTIGECAFNEWKKGTKLTSLNLPNATTIGDWAFAYSSLLTSINLPKVTSIGMFAFGYCDLRTLNLPEVTTIDGEAFYNNENLVSCSAPKATTIDYYPWGNCSRLETLELTAAGDFTLSNNLFANTPTGQINLVLHKDKESQVTQNDDGTAIWKCKVSNGGYNSNTFKSITTVHIPAADDGDCTTALICSACGETVVEAKESHTTEKDENKATCKHGDTCDLCGTEYGEVGGHSFNSADGKCTVCGAACTHSSFADGECTACGILGGYCGSEKNEGGRESLWWYFQGGTLTISGAGDMAERMYADESGWSNMGDSITALVIDKGVTGISSEAFMLLSNLEQVTFAEDSLLTTIGGNAFDGCSSLKEITIPASVTDIDSNPFYGCTAMEIVHVAPGNTAYKDIEGVLYTIDGTTLLSYPYRKVPYTFTPPKGVTTIGDGAFAGTPLTELELTNDLTTVGETAFENCIKLEKITISSSVKNIAPYAFSLCKALRQVSAPCSWQKNPLYDFTSSDIVQAPDVAESIDEHDLSSWVPSADGLTHHKACSACGYVASEGEPHSTAAPDDKAATCTTLAYCSVCQSEYGEKSQTNHDESVVYTEADNGFCPHCDAYQSAVLNGDVYEISNAGQLYWFAAQVNSGKVNIHGKLMNNIVVNENVLNADGSLNGDGSVLRQWTPIHWYSGTFDGQNHTISGLYFDYKNETYVGLFDELNGTVRNVGIVDSYFYGDVYVGGVAGRNEGTVTGCYNTGTVKADATYPGGVVGCNEGTVTDCYNTGTVKAAVNFAGGVVGCNEGTVTGCYNTGTVSGNNYGGGVVGNNTGAVTGCYNTGTVSGGDSVGGVAGNNYQGTITSCYYLTGTANGGIAGADTAGQAEAKTTGQFASGEVTWLLNGESAEGVWKQTLNTDAVPGFTGGTVYYGYVDCGSTEAVYTNTIVSTEPVEHDYDNGFCEQVSGQTHYEPATLVTAENCTELGLTDSYIGYYAITNAGQLYWIADKVDNDNANFGAANVVLTDNITVNSGSITANSTGARVWNPIGRYTYSGSDNAVFSGTFDGNGKTVSGLYYNDSAKTSKYIGLVACVAEGGTVKHVTLSNSYISGYRYIGGIAGENYGTITGCVNNAAIGGEGEQGGIVGENRGTVELCGNTGTITNTWCYSGGIVGYSYGIIRNCWNTGSFSGGTSCAGGIVGTQDDRDSLTENCWSKGQVTGRDCGGIAGWLRGAATVQNCYSDKDPLVGQLSYNYGTPSEINVQNKSTEAFASGEVAYLLRTRAAAGTNVWGQNLDNGQTVQTVPTFDGADVYHGYASCADTKVKYTNNASASATPIAHVWRCTATATGEQIVGTCVNGCGTDGGKVTLTLDGTAVYDGTEKTVKAVGSLEGIDTLPDVTYVGDRINVGTFTASIKLGEAEAKVNFTIAKADLAFDTLENSKFAEGLVYDGTEKALVTEPGSIENGYIVFSLNPDGEYTTTIPVATEAGKYVVYWFAQGDKNHKDLGVPGEACCTVTIAAKPVTDATVTLGEYDSVYNGTAKEPGVASVIVDSMTLTAGKDYTVTYSNNVNAGTATVTIQGIGNFTGTVNKTFTISKAAASVTAVPTAKELTYTGEAQALVNAGTTADGKLVYSLSENGTYTETIPTGNNASDYMVWYYVQGDDNHADSAKASVKVTIAKAKAEISVATTPITVTYGETVELPIATSNFGTVSCDKTASDLVNAGTYTVTYSVEGTANYEGDSKTVTVTVEKLAVAEPTVTSTHTYTKSEQTAQLADVESYMTIASGNKATNAGSYEVVITLDGNHKWADGSDGKVQWSIGKAQAQISVNTDPITVTYGETVTLPTATTNFGAVVCDKTAADLVNAGTYTVTYTVAGTDNYDGDTKSITVIVNAKAITVTAEAKSKTYGDADPKLTYTVVGLENNDTLTGELKRAAGENVGSYAIGQGTLTAGSNYIVNYNDAAMTINAKAITEADVKLSGSLAYTGAEQTQPITVTKGITYTVTGDKATDVGTYELTVKGTDNYTGEVKLSWSIRAAVAVVGTAPTAKELTYTGEEQALVNAGTTADGKLVYSLSENGEFTETIPAGTNVGEYTVWYYVDGDYNHSDSAKASVKVTIAKAKAEISVDTTPITVTYGETVELPNATSSFGTVSCDKTADELVNAGTYTVTYTVEGTDNYEGDTKTVTVTIEKLAVAEPTVTDTYTYTGKEQMVTLTGVESYMTVVSGNKAVGAGSYEAVITLDGNHKWADGSDGKVQWSIGKAEFGDVYVSQSGMLTYNRTAQTPKVNTDADSEGDQTATFAYRLTENEPYGEMPAFTDAGTYTVYYKASAPNHKDATGSFTVMVDKAKAEITVDTDPITVTYGDTVELPDATANFGTVSCDKTAAELVNVGTYTVTYTVAGTDNYDGDTKTVTVKINPKAITEDDVQLNGSLVYTGSEQTQQITVTAGIDFEVTGNKATNVGSYTLTVTASGNYIGSVTKDWSIKAAAAIVETAPKANNLTYTGEAQELVTAGTVKGGKLVYSLTEDGEYTETIPAGTNVGEYTVWYYVDGDYNHSDSAKASVKVTIAKAKAEISVDTTPITVTYGETVELPNATSSFGTVSCDKTADELVNAGTYTVTYTVEVTDNYEGDTKTVTVTIEKLAVAEPTVTGTYTYTGEEQTAQLTGVESCMTVASGDKATNAGSYEAEITLDGNHQWAEGSDGKVQWSIGKAQAEIAVNTDPITAVYGGTVKLPEATANFGTVTCDTTADKLVNAGTYTVTYTVASTANFDGDSKTVTVTVNPKAITEADVSLNGSLVYTGSELTQAVTVTAGVTYEVTGNKATDVGTYELTVKATGNYTGEVKLNWSIKETAAVVTKAPAAKTLTYTGTAQNLVNAGSANGGTMVYSLSENGQYTETIPTGANAGEYTVWYYVQGDANHSDTAKASIKVMIHRASATFEITNNVVLEGTEIKLTVTSEPANVSHEVSYRQDGKSVAVPAAVGEYDVYITITDSNYRHATSTDGSALKVGVLSIYKEETPETYTLSYAAGGATGTMSAEQAALAGTVRILPESTFTAPKDENDNAMLFAGWNDGTAVYQPGEKYVQPEQNVTMTAVWQVEKHNISGMVKQYVSLDSTERVNREGVTITLMLGSRQITQTVTDENGNYQFEHCLQGTYNLIAEYEGIKQTIKVVLGHSDQTGQEIDLPAAKTNTAVAVQPGTPAVVVGGMDDMMTKTDDTVFTEEDKDTVEAGGEVEIKMDIKENPAPANKAEIDQKVEDSLNTSATVELYIDLDLTKTVRDANGTEQSSTAITESNVLLENIIFLPGHLQGKDAYHVFRQHGNDVEEMKELPAGTEVKEEGFVVDRTNHTITIYSRKYSTFAIVTSEVFTITFDANGGTVGTSTMETEEKLNTLPTPERSGFKFIGWFTEKTGGTEVDTSTVFTQDTTVYAQWERIGYQIEFPTTDTTGTIKAGGVVEIDGKLVTIDNNGEIWMPATGSKLLVSYKFNENADPHKEYPTAMYAWFLKWEGDTCEAIRIPELDNFMTYKGTSIRVGHSSDGIRFFTAVPVDALNKVMAGTLLTGELEGYKLVEMGTLYKWAATGTELTIENGAKSYVYGGSAGSTYRQFSKEGDLSWFTGMLTDLPGDAQTLAKDILSRPYAVFQKGNDTIVLYGGSIQRSIYYVALQNKDTWATGTAYDNYVEKIISTVDAANG